MLLVSYDISNDKVRARFSKFLKKYGYRLQFSLYEIKNSQRILDNIRVAIQGEFADQFTESDSVLIFHMSKNCKIEKYGYAKHHDDSLVII